MGSKRKKNILGDAKTNHELIRSTNAPVAIPERNPGGADGVKEWSIGNANFHYSHGLVLYASVPGGAYVQREIFRHAHRVGSVA